MLKGLKVRLLWRPNRGKVLGEYWGDGWSGVCWEMLCGMVFGSLRKNLYLCKIYRLFEKMKKVLLWSIVLCMLTGCEYIRERRMGESVVTVGGASLHASDLAMVTSSARNPEDSAMLADAYIRRWVTEQLLYDKAKRSSSDASSIEALVEDYRRSLYVHEYEQSLVDSRMPKEVSDDSVVAFYEHHSERFVLREDILQGMLIVLPINAPHLDDLRKCMGDLTDDNMEKIEKYAYQYATSYDLFTDQWRSLHSVMMKMPVSSKEVEQEIRHNRLIESSDSSRISMLRVTDRHLQGEAMPMEYARTEIEKVLLNQRQVQFLQRQREEMYQQAVRQKRVVFNTNTETKDESNDENQ